MRHLVHFAIYFSVQILITQTSLCASASDVQRLSQPSGKMAHAFRFADDFHAGAFLGVARTMQYRALAAEKRNLIEQIASSAHAARGTSAQIATTGAHFCTQYARTMPRQKGAESAQRIHTHTYNNIPNSSGGFREKLQRNAVGARARGGLAYMRWRICARVVLTQSVSLCANVFLRGTMEEGRSDDGNNAGKIMAAEWSCAR